MNRATLQVRTQSPQEILDITPRVQAALADLGLADGAVLIFCPHTTCALTVNEVADPDVRADVSHALYALVPAIPFRHSEGNSPAHLLAALLGPSLLLPVEGGRLCLGTWQGVYLCEFDGPRTRSVWIYPLEGQIRSQ
ncbi:secondary thiamine-phosphate synthase enzyme YjbQ [Candidatus Bipolaricaulota bacterium]|nr:secondary thiamine-phosphate synthase enzyme YjbQ [Candidatus Bipolaricaulota bacterium]